MFVFDSVTLFIKRQRDVDEQKIRNSAHSQLCFSQPSGFSMLFMSKNLDVPVRTYQHLHQESVGYRGSEPTRIALPVKVVLRITVTAEFLARLLACGTVGERNVVVSNVIKEVNFFFLQEQTGSNRMHRSVTPTLIEETTISVQ